MEEEITHIEFIKKLLDVLNKCNITYMLIGGIAAVYYGRNRSTNDCDIAISLKENEISYFCDCLKKAGFKIHEYDVLMGFKEKSHFNATYGNYLYFRADFSWIEASNLNKRGFERAQIQELFGVRVILEKIEDLIIAKLVYGSPMDIEDATSVFRKQIKNIDKKYLAKRAEEEGVKNKLEDLLKLVED